MNRKCVALTILGWILGCASELQAQNRYATSDNLSGYVHWIDLYDATNTRIDPTAENAPPYSPEKTCGRCHAFDVISHGWHFNALDANAVHGRRGQPWVWSDERTGTYLPLSYRNWKGTHHPQDLGLSRWQIAAELGGYMPGGGVGATQDSSSAHPRSEESDDAGEADVGGEPEKPEPGEDRTSVTGPLPVDCMMCHRNQGSGYSPFVWTEQIEDENFAYAPTAALGLATVSGNMSRLKDDFDPNAEGAQDKLPKVAYETSRFRSDGKVFFDLVRKPKSDACYYCHSNLPTESALGQRWAHDQDVHIRAGLSCADCHRNSIDHHTVRGFEGEQHASGSIAASLSCQGCHLGTGFEGQAVDNPGRFGAPKPAHRGLPPLHFEKMSCTACHSGPGPSEVAGRQLNSILHHLGEHVKRTGQEFPGIVAGVQLPVAQVGDETEPADAELDHSGTSKYAPHRMMWPSFWGLIRKDEVEVLPPEKVYELIRKPLKVRREFTEELGNVRLSLSTRKELLGDERARARAEDWTDEEKNKIEAAEAEARAIQVNERIANSLAALEEAYPDGQAVFVSGGAGFVRKGEAELQTVNADKLGASAQPYAWPIAHNVRPARQSLGATGCLECHSDQSVFFNTEVQPVGLLPDQQVVSFQAHELQNVDMERMGNWNQMFTGRAFFKVIGLIALALTGVVTLSTVVWNIGNFWRRTV